MLGKGARPRLAVITVATLFISLLAQPDVAGSSTKTPTAASNGRLVFAVGIDPADRGDMHLYTVRPDGTGLQRLIDTPAGVSNFWPTWSADGSSVAYVSSTGNSSLDEVYRVKSDGSGKTRLTFDAGGSSADADWDPQWSPAGGAIAWVKGTSATQIWVMDANGANPVKLTQTGDNQAPAWSPDGSKIVFMNSTGGANGEIWVMDADGGNPTQLTNNAVWDDFPAWSPDGSTLAFYEAGDLWLMDANGAHKRQLTTDGAACYETNPVWSPDGQQIAIWCSQTLSNSPLEILDASSGNLVADLTPPNYYRLYSVDWRADSLPPASTIDSPKPAHRYPPRDLLTLKGTATDFDSAVGGTEIALRLTRRSGACRWYTAGGFVAGACSARRWVPAVGGHAWHLALSSRLKASVDSGILGYRLFSRATDASGNVEMAFAAGRNSIGFEVG